MHRNRPLTGAERVANRCAALRALGLKPKTIWVPDRNSEIYQAQARRDVAVLNAWYAANAQEMAWTEAMAENALALCPPEDHDNLNAATFSRRRLDTGSAANRAPC